MSNTDFAGNPVNSTSNSTPTDRSLEPVPETSETSYDTDIASISRTSSRSNYGTGYPEQLLYKVSEISNQEAGDLPPSGKQRSTKIWRP